MGRFADDKRFSIIHSPFGDMAEEIEALGLTGKIDGVLMDLGVSSPQLDDAERGFSFLRDGPLDMRMDTSRGQSAADWLANAEEQPITRTAQLAKIIDEAVPVKDKFKHPATRAFQGIRIYINAELEQLRVGLKAATQVLAKEGRLAVISFH